MGEYHTEITEITERFALKREDKGSLRLKLIKNLTRKFEGPKGPRN